MGLKTSAVVILALGVLIGSPRVGAQVVIAERPDLEVVLTGRAMSPGEVIRLDVTCRCGSAVPVATAFGLAVPLTPSPDRTRWQGFVGLDLDLTPGTYPVTVRVPDRQPVLSGEAALRVEPKQFPMRTLRVAPEFVDPPPAVVDRILAEASTLDALFKVVTPRAWRDSFVLPLSTEPSRNFGSRSVFNGQVRAPHAGIDFSSPTGTLVTAPASGTVVLAADLFFTGQTVIIDHGGGVYSLFAHLSSMIVATGTVVARGDSLGRVGATGRVTGPHLHWGVRLNAARVDPLSLLVATEDSQPRTPPVR